MEHIQKPITWTVKLTEWDIDLLKKYPYGVEIPRKNYKYHYEICEEWIPDHFTKGTYAWKAMQFFFANEDDAILFSLRWL